MSITKRDQQELDPIFLRTKEIFRRCMDAGYDKYGWTKRSL
jgi:hypothetical protein